MNYDAQITDLITAIKADKSIIQPWRNYAIKAANEMISFIEKGQRTTNMRPHEGMTDVQRNYYNSPPVNACICFPGMTRLDCPVHGGGA